LNGVGKGLNPGARGLLAKTAAPGGKKAIICHGVGLTSSGPTLIKKNLIKPKPSQNHRQIV
jgi:hypothetical protein